MTLGSAEVFTVMTASQRILKSIILLESTNQAPPPAFDDPRLSCLVADALQWPAADLLNVVIQGQVPQPRRGRDVPYHLGLGEQKIRATYRPGRKGWRQAPAAIILPATRHSMEQPICGSSPPLTLRFETPNMQPWEVLELPREGPEIGSGDRSISLTLHGIHLQLDTQQGTLVWCHTTETPYATDVYHSLRVQPRSARVPTGRDGRNP